MVYSNKDATSKRWHLWEIDVRFALNSTQGGASGSTRLISAILSIWMQKIGGNTGADQRLVGRLHHPALFVHPDAGVSSRSAVTSQLRRGMQGLRKHCYTHPAQRPALARLVVSDGPSCCATTRDEAAAPLAERGPQGGSACTLRIWSRHAPLRRRLCNAEI